MIQQRSLSVVFCVVFAAACSGGNGDREAVPGDDPGKPALSDDTPSPSNDVPRTTGNQPPLAATPNDTDLPGTGPLPPIPDGDASDCANLCARQAAAGCEDPQACETICIDRIGGACGRDALALADCGTSVGACSSDIDGDTIPLEVLNRLLATCQPEVARYQACLGRAD